MTYEEAIKNINALNAVCGQKGLYDAEFESALELAILALEKQIPKKPLHMHKITIVQSAKKMDGCCGMTLSPMIWTNIVASAVRQLIGR